MMRAKGLIFFILFYLLPCNGQQFEIHGKAEQFANSELYLEISINPFLGSTEILDTLFFDDTGCFSASINYYKATWAQIHSGIYQTSAYFEPGQSYEISLPPNIQKSEGEIRSPFFKPITTHLRVLEQKNLSTGELLSAGNDLNSQIFNFDTLLFSKNQNMLATIGAKKRYNSDSLIRNIELQYVNEPSDYFKKYRGYRYGLIKINSRDAGLKTIFDRYMPKEEIAINDPAFMDLFGEMYNEFLFYFSRSPEGKSISSIINRKHSLSMLLDSLNKHPAIPNNTLAELVVIKDIYDNYSKNYFYKEALLIILDSISKDPVSIENGRYAQEIFDHLIRLKSGTTPPYFNLLDQNGERKTLADFKGKYVYLNFCTPDNYSCMIEFPFLRALYLAHYEHLDIVTVLITEKQEEMSSFMRKNGYTWTALFYENDDQLLRNYNVRAYPTCFLIDPEGKMIQSPATLATEGFEQQLFRIMRSRGDL